MRGKLRKAKLDTGKYSLYIDYYPPVWNPHTLRYTRREYLKLYLYPKPKTDLEKQENALAIQIAEKIYVKRMKSLMLDAQGIFNKDVLEGDFYQYYEGFIRKKSKDEVETSVHTSAIQHLKTWRPEYLKFKFIDELFLEGFKQYLKSATFLKSEVNKLKPNSQAIYYDKVASVVQQAFIERYLPEDYTLRVKRIPNVESQAEKLDIDDFAILQRTPCPDPMVYRSSIFAYLSGFRYSAIEALRWEDLLYSSTLACWYVNIIDPKTDRLIKHFICQEAVEILGKRKADTDPVFPNISYYRVRKGLKEWFHDAGLSKKARFHNWRRRYASNLTFNDVDGFIIKSMLHHKHMSTTDIYIDVDEVKRADAANKMKLPKK